MEDGTTVPSKQGSDVLSPDIMMNSDGQPVRFGFDESVFPGYSWRGYASMSDIQVQFMKGSFDNFCLKYCPLLLKGALVIKDFS